MKDCHIVATTFNKDILKSFCIYIYDEYTYIFLDIDTTSMEKLTTRIEKRKVVAWLEADFITTFLFVEQQKKLIEIYSYSDNKATNRRT